MIPKPAADSLSYERPPPLELLPFAIRNDHYLSIGTAFAQHLYSVTFSAGTNMGYRDVQNVHGMIMGGLKLLE